jgi:hypothetical protein
MRPFGTVC